MSQPREHEQRSSHELADVEVRTNAAVLAALAGFTDLTPIEHRVILCSLAHMDPRTGLAPLKREEIAHHVCASAASVSRATTKLKDLGLLWRMDRDHLQVNPHFGFRGDSRAEWEQAVRDLSGEAPAIRIPTGRRTPTRPARAKQKPHLRLVK